MASELELVKQENARLRARLFVLADAVLEAADIRAGVEKIRLDALKLAKRARMLDDLLNDSRIKR